MPRTAESSITAEVRLVAKVATILETMSPRARTYVREILDSLDAEGDGAGDRVVPIGAQARPEPDTLRSERS